MRLRPLRHDDVPAAAAVVVDALPSPPRFAPSGRQAWVEHRLGHLLGSDPESAWLAEDDDGTALGTGLGIVRDGVWGLSLLAVRPDRHGRGTGRALLQATLGTAAGCRGAIIASSSDPKATRIYAQAGFDLRPCVAAGGIVRRERLPAGLRSAPSEDLEVVAELGRQVRGAAYDPQDLRTLWKGEGLLRLGDRGFAVHRGGDPLLLCATDDEAATDLLWSCLAAAPAGATIDVDFLTAGQDWAIRTVLDAGLALTPDGPLFTRGALGPLRPWIPSGALL